MKKKQLKNEENDNLNLLTILKKYSFLGVLMGAFLVHFTIKIIGFSYYYEMSILIVLWVFTGVYLMGYVLSFLPHNKKWDQMLKDSEPNVIKIRNMTVEKSEKYLFENGRIITSVVKDVMVKNVYNSSICGCVLIEYEYPFSWKYPKRGARMPLL